MARPVDEKIVRMTLDNARFKQRVKETVSSFNSINKGISSVGNPSALSRVAEGIATIERRFSAAGVVMATVIHNLTNQAINLGRRMAGAIIDPLVEGGRKRALNIEQAQFQFEGLGMDVEKTMESALEAVKGTAFGLDEAAVVASQFGATGMRAGEEMTAALRGISGVAAMTGSSYSDIGSIFTTVAGNGRLMGAELLRLSSRGVNAAATLAKALNLTEAEVREMVSKGQISFEMFASAMNDAFGEHATKANETYTGSLSNLRAALARIGAAVAGPGFQNQRDIFNALTPQVDALADAIGPLIEAWNQFHKISTERFINFVNGIDFSNFIQAGGMTNLVGAFWNVLNSGVGILKAISDGLSRVFPPVTYKTFLNLSKIIYNITNMFKMNREEMEKVTTIFQGVFAIFSTVWEIAKRLGQALFNLIPSGLGGSVLDVLVKVAELSIKLNEFVKQGGNFTGFLGKVGERFSWITDGIKAFTSGLKQAFNILLRGDFVGGIFEEDSRIVDFLFNLREGFFSLGGAIAQTYSILRGNDLADGPWSENSTIVKVLTKIGEAFRALGGFIKNLFSGIGTNEILGGGVLTGAFLIVQRINSTFEKFGGVFDTFKQTILGVGDEAKGLRGMFDQIGGAIQSFQEKIKYDNLLKVAIAIGILAVSLKLLESLDARDIAQGLFALAGSMGVLAGGMGILDKIDAGLGIRSSIMITALATSVLIMAVALKRIADLKPSELAVGIGGLVGIVTALSLAVIAMSRLGKKVAAGSIQLIALATAVYILAGAVQKMASIDSGDLWRSVGALGVIFAEIAIFLKVVNGSKLGIASAVGVAAIAGAIHLMVSAMGKIANMDNETLTKGLTTLGIILLELAAFAKIAQGPMLLAAGAGMVLVAVGLQAMMGPLLTFSKMSWEEIGKGLAMLAGSLLAIAGASKLAATGAGGAIAITVIAFALNMLLIPIKTFSAMSWEALIKGFVGLAGGLAVVALSAMLLQPAVGAMLGFGAALALMGAAMFLAGAGVGLFGAGLATLAGMSAVSIAAIISSLNLLIVGMTEIRHNIIRFIVEISISLIEGIMDIAKPLAKAVVDLIIILLDAITDKLPEFIDLGVLLVTQLIDGMKKHVGPLIQSGVELIMAYIEGITNAVEKNGPQFISAILKLLGEVLILFVEAGLQVVNALFGWIPGVNEATANIGDSATKMIRSTFGAAEVGTTKGQEFADAMAKKKKAAENSGKALANAGQDGAKRPSLASIGLNFGTSFANGMSSRGVISKVASAARSIARTAADRVKGWLGIASPSKVAMEDGGWFGEGLARGILDKTKRVGDSAKSLALQARESLHEFIEGFEPDMEDNEIHFKAVVDYDDFDPDAFGGPRSMAIVPDTGFTNNLVRSTGFGFRQNGNNVSSNNDSSNDNGNSAEEREKRPAIIQVVTPDRREIARWLVDDVTEFQDFRLSREAQF